MNSFYSEDDLRKIGFKSIGKSVLISRKTSIYGAERIVIGNNVRIDDFCILSGKISLGNNIHIAAYCALYGGNSGITFNDFSTISSRGCVYAVSDDYSGETMTNPTIPDKYKNVVDKKVVIGRHCVIGTDSTILPGSVLNEGVAVGAKSLIKGECEEWTIYVGTPVRAIRERKRNLLEIEQKFLQENKN